MSLLIFCFHIFIHIDMFLDSEERSPPKFIERVRMERHNFATPLLQQDFGLFIRIDKHIVLLMTLF